MSVSCNIGAINKKTTPFASWQTGCTIKICVIGYWIDLETTCENACCPLRPMATTLNQ